MTKIYFFMKKLETFPQLKQRLKKTVYKDLRVIIKINLTL